MISCAKKHISAHLLTGWGPCTDHWILQGPLKFGEEAPPGGGRCQYHYQGIISKGLMLSMSNKSPPPNLLSSHPSLLSPTPLPPPMHGIGFLVQNKAFTLWSKISKFSTKPHEETNSLDLLSGYDHLVSFWMHGVLKHPWNTAFEWVHV